MADAVHHRSRQRTAPVSRVNGWREHQAQADKKDQLMNMNEPWVITPTSLSKRCDRVTLYRFGRDTFSIVTVQ
jgi:hypothetical protein